MTQPPKEIAAKVMPEEIFANRYNYYRKGQLIDEVKYIRADLATSTQSGSVVAGQDGYVWKHPHQSAEYILRDAIYFAERHTGGEFPLMYLLPLAKAAKLSQSGSVAGLYTALSNLYEETADYITINNLGDVHHNASMKLAKLELDAYRKENGDE